jgi:uncharacterized protein (DUF1330 family)
VPKRVVVLEFPDMDSLKAWYDSPEYVPLKDVRHRCADANLIVADGV